MAKKSNKIFDVNDTKSLVDKLSDYSLSCEDNNAEKKEIKELLWLYVSNCPSKKGPKCAKKFHDYGLTANVTYKNLKERILQKLNLLTKKTYLYYKNTPILDQTIWALINKSLNSNEKLVFLVKGDFAEIDSLYIRLRNALAHGNFIRKRKHYFLWNTNKNDELCFFVSLYFDDLIFIFNSLTNFKTTNLEEK